MVGIYFKGRLGNQIFQYVFYKYLKSKFKNTFIFFVNPHHTSLARYFQLDRIENISLGNKLYSAFSRVLPRLFRLKKVIIDTIIYPKEIKLVDNSVYYGYYQTDYYVKQIGGKINLPIKEKYVNRFEDLYGDIFKNEKTITVHIRRTDYLSYGKRDISLPIEYFQARLAAIENLNLYRIFFLSDDMEYVRSVFPEKPNYIFSGNDEITDFQIIQNADIAIISNSSFAWWACYLSNKKQNVIAPKNWIGFRFGKEHPKKIMTDKFNWFDVI